MATGILKEEYSILHDENDQYKLLISQQKGHLVSLDKEMTVVENRIQEKLTVPGGILQQQGKHRNLRKHIRILENKLNQNTIKFDELLCSNMLYREHIAHLLQQKSIGCNIEEKFDRQLATEQNILEKLRERFSLALKRRSEAETWMLEAKERIEVETAQFTKTQMHLRTVIDHDTKLHTFMARKLQEMNPMGDDDDDSKTRSKQQQYQNGAKPEMYMQGHSTLVEVTGERDLRQIGHMFIQSEQKNFAHIKYINELHDRRNMLKSCTDKMKSNILFLEQENRGHDEQDKSQLKDLESELEKYSSLANSLAQQCTEVHRTLDQLKNAINGLLDEIMHEAAIATLDNITHFTSILEETISNLLIQANDVEDGQTELLMTNSDLLPNLLNQAAVVEKKRSRSSTRSLKSA